jgi:hypothetical protein
MNNQYEPPADGTPESQPAEEARLKDIERRLKRARPAPPNFDLGDWSISRSIDALHEKPTAENMDLSPSARPRRPYRGLAVAAGSWTCGALAGAIAMFFFLGRSGPAGDLTDRQSPVTKTVERSDATNAGQVVPSTGFAPKSRSELDERRAAVLAMLADPYGIGRFVQKPDGLPLHAGIHLGYGADRSPQPPEQLAAVSMPPGRRTMQRPAEAIKQPPSSFIPSPGTTRERLLDDLMKEMTGSVL